MLSPIRLALRSCRPTWTCRAVTSRSGIAPLTAGASRRLLHGSHSRPLRASACQASASPSFAFEAPNKGQPPLGVRGDEGVSPKSDETAPEFEAKTVLEASISGGKPITVACTDEFLHVEDKALGGWTRLYASTLRDSCPCPTCTDPSSGQKNFGTAEIPGDVEIENIRLVEDGIGIAFRNDIPRLARHNPQHEMVLAWDILEKALGHRNIAKLSHPRQDAIYPKTGRTFWDKATINSRIRRIDYAEFMKGEDAFWQVLLDLASLGLVFLKNVPAEHDAIVAITTRIANIKETFYGRTFDVRAKPDAENVAYTSGYLGLHQDLLYLERPPAIQLLHCLENSCAGGESLFSDGLRAGKLLWLQESHRGVVEPLANVRVPYHYEKHGYWYRQARPLLSVAPGNDILGSVYWSPPFQDRFPVPAADLRPWLEPARLFDTLINDEQAMYQVKMLPGECVLFDNLRVMHGRRAFDASGGSRWLRGAYIEREDVVSRILHVPEDMAREYRGGEDWSPKAEDEALRASGWFGDVKARLDGVAKGLSEKSAKMRVEDCKVLNGELVDVV